MRRGIEALTVMIVLALGMACAETGQEAGTADEAADTAAADTMAMAGETFEDARAAIEEMNASFEETFTSDDVAGGMRAAYTEDAAIYPPGGAPVEGRDAIADFWAGAAEGMDVTGVDLETVELEPAGDGRAVEVGTFTIQGPDGVMDSGSYMVVWKRTPDGWKLHRDIWNSDGPAEEDTP